MSICIVDEFECFPILLSVSVLLNANTIVRFWKLTRAMRCVDRDVLGLQYVEPWIYENCDLYLLRVFDVSPYMTHELYLIYCLRTSKFKYGVF